MKTTLKPSIINLELIIEENKDQDAFAVIGPTNALVAIKTELLIAHDSTDDFFGEHIDQEDPGQLWGFLECGTNIDNEFFVNDGAMDDSEFRFRAVCDSTPFIEQEIKVFLNPPEAETKQPDWQLITFQETK